MHPCRPNYHHDNNNKPSRMERALLWVAEREHAHFEEREYMAQDADRATDPIVTKSNELRNSLMNSRELLRAQMPPPPNPKMIKLTDHHNRCRSLQATCQNQQKELLQLVSVINKLRGVNGERKRVGDRIGIMLNKEQHDTLAKFGIHLNQMRITHDLTNE